MLSTARQTKMLIQNIYCLWDRISLLKSVANFWQKLIYPLQGYFNSGRRNAKRKEQIGMTLVRLSLSVSICRALARYGLCKTLPNSKGVLSRDSLPFF